MRLLLACVVLTLVVPAVLPEAEGSASGSSLAPSAEERPTTVPAAVADRPTGGPPTVAESLTGGPPPAEDVARAMADVFRWQLERLDPPSDPGWIQSTFMTGVVAAYEATGDDAYLDAALEWAERNEWRLGTPIDHADRHAAAQVYLDLARISGDPSLAAQSEEALGALLEAPGAGRELWSWCDALFMTPPALTRLAAATGDTGYLGAMDARWRDATELLYDTDAHLFYRDEEARIGPGGETPRSRWGNKLFWSRGNGWVLSGIARLLPFLPPDRRTRDEYLRLYAEMAETIAAHQGEDGLWSASVLDPRDALPPESSASALFCYALAWGINEGILPRDAYLPVVARAWNGLLSCVGEEGAFGWVQPPGRRPALSFADGTAPYGAGAFLLAGSEMLRLQ
jgi:unsaturated rhamnogalacturonyl hydrolase